MQETDKLIKVLWKLWIHIYIYIYLNIFIIISFKYKDLKVCLNITIYLLWKGRYKEVLAVLFVILLISQIDLEELIILVSPSLYFMSFSQKLLSWLKWVNYFLPKMSLIHVFSRLDTWIIQSHSRHFADSCVQMQLTSV